MGSIPTSTHHEDVKDLIVARSASVYVTLRSLEARSTVFETWDDDMNDHAPFTSAEKLTRCHWNTVGA